ncbi:MFS transporter [Acinetobacter sp. ANC 4282]|jgi:MFS family permease|uniref:MFS transporter n=1 Tax=Acinetobacter terrae TaxID=2731247 RepID=A0ABX1V072_9GAMM|nr:MFS transporter [Acinetobacter terrae]NNH17224.1 MFS transporter [Acinetobacter terrae]NNH86494.1 MFS transporter [Acinetobacter terrae]OTG77869.1 MFS transporter [Acinetobacter terrae]
MSPVNAQQLWNKSFILCLANNLFLFIFYFAQTTILPIYILNELHGTLAQAGLAMTLFMASSIAVRPFSGLIIEKIGRKKALYISETLFCLFSFAYIFADNLTFLLVIRLFHGIWFSILTTVTVPIANDFIPANRKGEGMGYFVMSVNLGIVLGPLIGLTLIQQLSYQMVAAILAGIICLGFAFCFLIPIQETIKNQVETVKRKLSVHDFVEKKALPVSVMAMIVSFSYASIMSFISTFAESKNLLAYASLFFVVFAISMMSLRPITGKIYDRKGPNFVVYPAIALFSIGLIVLSQINSVTGLMIAAVFVGMGFGSAQPCLQTISIQHSPKNRIGHATSTFFTCYDIGIAIGSILLGMVIAHQGYSFAYLLCALITALSLVFYKLFVDRKHTAA